MAGALFLWCYMPPALRELAKLAATGELNIPDEVWRESGRRNAENLNLESLTSTVIHHALLGTSDLSS